MTLDTECSLKTAGDAALVFKPLSAGEFTSSERDAEELLRSVARDSGSEIDRKTDSFGFEWVIVHGNRPSATTNATLPIVDATTGEVLGQPKVHGIPIAIALSSSVFAVLTTLAGPHDRISWFSATDGTKLGSVLVSSFATPQLAASDQLIVYRTGRLLRDVSTSTGHLGKLVQTGLNNVGLALAHSRLIWAENHNGTGRLRALAVG